jgi:hypothetical protein
MAENMKDAKSSETQTQVQPGVEKARVTLYVTKETRVALRVLAAKRDCQVSELVDSIISEALKRPEYQAN